MWGADSEGLLPLRQPLFVQAEQVPKVQETILLKQVPRVEARVQSVECGMI